MEDLRPALQQVLEEWERFERALSDASLHTTRVHCSLQHPPLYSLRQAQGHMDILEVWEGKNVNYYRCLVHCHDGCSRDLKDVLFLRTASSGGGQKRGGSLGVSRRILQGSCEDCSSRNCSAPRRECEEWAKTVRHVKLEKKCVANHGDNHCWMLHLVYIICDVKHLFIFSDSIQLRLMLRELLLKSFTWGFHSIHPPL